MLALGGKSEPGWLKRYSDKMIKRFVESLRTMDQHQRNYWLGLLLLFVGLTWSLIGLTVVGAVMVVESTITSYLVVWLSAKQPLERK